MFSKTLDRAVLVAGALAVLLAGAAVWSVVVRATVAEYGYEVVNVYPHDPTAFTQGLAYHDGLLYEGTGRYGHSELRRVRLETGEVLDRHRLAAEHFGEGIAVLGKTAAQLTWQSGTGFLFDVESWAPFATFTYPGEGWGITHDNVDWFLSDGTAELRILDGRTMKERSRLKVKLHGRPLAQLNELEYVDRLVYANVFRTNGIVMISPATGEVSGIIHLTGLLSPEEAKSADVLNGIAYDHKTRRLFVTGKNWPKLFEIRPIPR